MSSQQIFERKGKRYSILQAGWEYVDNNESKCIRPPGKKACITIQNALKKGAISEDLSNNIAIFAPQTEENYAGRSAEQIVFKELQEQKDVRPQSLKEKIDNIYFMPVDQLRAQVFLAHGLIYPSVYDKSGLSTDFDDCQRQSPTDLVLFETAQPINKKQLLLKILLNPDEIANAERVRKIFTRSSFF
ncbi:hypothetical protein HGB07_07805 [Candidatus Roizmanbacteria bacterium]|nr:hypothetical protein [Candidatus Roizmanbacteria bacterium]